MLIQFDTRMSMLMVNWAIVYIVGLSVVLWSFVMEMVYLVMWLLMVFVHVPLSVVVNWVVILRFD